MPARRLLYLNGHQLSAYHWQAGVLIAEGSFDAGNVGSLPFAGYLAQHSKSIFSILANVSEEGFHIETIPFLRGGDRRAIIARKLGQLFFNVSLSASLSLGHQKSRRKDERILLAAFTNHELFAPWLAAMANAEVALAGIYSLPLLGPLLLKKLGVARDPCLLLSIQDQSIRQSYLENGELHFSRLTPLTNSSIGGIAQTFASEAAKLQQYLVSQRLIGRQQPLVAYLLAHANTRKAIESSCIDSDTLVFAILDIEESARLCGLKALPENTHCEPLFLNLLATDPPRSQFADDELRHNYHLWLLRAVLRGTAAVLLLGCLLLSGKLLVDTQRLKQEVEVLQAETALASRRYADIVKTFPPIPTTNEALRQVIDRYLELERNSTSPDALYREISRALEDVPAVELDAIDWQVSDALASRPASASDSPNSGPAPAASESAVVRGTVRLGADSNPRQILAVFNRLVDALKSNSKLLVEVQQQPFDVESGKSLKGGSAAADEQLPRAFEVQIRRNIES